ncbi:MAG: alpha/beta hydrolase [Bacteroidota bacterium]
MKPEIIYIHGAVAIDYDAKTDQLLNQLKDRTDPEISIHTPRMANPIDQIGWLDALDAMIHKLDSAIILIGHSLGASTILKYLSERAIENPIESIHLFATPFWKNNGWQSDYALSGGAISRLKKYPDIHLYHCEDDEGVPYEHLLKYLSVIPHASAHKLKKGGHYFTSGIPNSKVQITQSINHS